MSKKPIAEIMGWEGEHEFLDGFARCSWCDTRVDEVHVMTGPKCPDNIAGPTPDDMLAWIAEKGWLCSIIHWKHGFDVVTRRYYGVDACNTHAPTLHAALEAAVRAVAEVDDE